MTLSEALSAIKPPDGDAMRRTQRHLDSLLKPLGSLGMLERHLVKIAGITGRDRFDFSRKAAVVFCADNGIVAQGVTQSGQEVTAIVSENMAVGDTCLCAMCKVAGVDVIPVDIGVAADISPDVTGLLRRKVAYGTADFTLEPAMTHVQSVAALEVGINLAIELKSQGYNMLATGEMGIGNTVTTAAMAAVLLGKSPDETCGRGSGLSDDGLKRKIQVVKDGIELHKPASDKPLEVLAAVGGLDIAGMAGLCIGGAACGIPVVLDGSISCIAALTACGLNPLVREYILPSHLSPEPSAAMVLEELGLLPLLHAGMRLGEGSGAVATFPLYDMILSVYNSMITFSEESMEDYPDYIPLQRG